MIDVGFKIDPGFRKRLVGRYERFEVRAGILQDGRHYGAKSARRGLTTVAGGPARKINRRRSEQTLKQVGEIVRKRHRIDYIRAPFARHSAELALFRKAFLELITGKTKRRQPAEDALRDVIREPIIRKRYGSNSAYWARVKTFNRFLVDTGQFLNSITAKIFTRRRGG